MCIKLTLEINSENAVQDATELKELLNDQNIRGVIVEQLEAEPEPGALSGGGLFNEILLKIDPDFVIGAVTAIGGLLSTGFFAKTKSIESNENIELEKIKSAERIRKQELKIEEKKIKTENELELEKLKSAERTKMRELDIKEKYINLKIESENKKRTEIITKENVEKMDEIVTK